MGPVLVVGREWKFRVLVRAELREAGYEALGLETLDDAGDLIARSLTPPVALLFDLAESSDPAREMARIPSLAGLLPVFLIASPSLLPNAATIPEHVTLLLRPVSVADIVQAVRERLGTRSR